MGLICLASCVPNRKVLFLQKDDVNKQGLPTDTVQRVHSMIINEYKIQPLDLLSINFETLSDETDQFDFLSKLTPRGRTGGTGGSGSQAALIGIFVDAAGDIEYAILGKIHVAGLTIFQAQDKIREIGARYMPDVVVRVRMLNFRFTVLGEVNGETVVTASNPRVTMMEAVGMAGGFTDLADRRDVKLIRQKGDKSEVFYIDLLKEEFLESPLFYVQQNDLIIVPPLKQRPLRKYAISNFGIMMSVISFGILIYTLSSR